MKNKIKTAGLGLLGLLATTALPNQEAEAQQTRRPIPEHIQAKIDSAKAVEPLGIFDVMTSTDPFSHAPLIKSDSTQNGFSQLETFLDKYVGTDAIGTYIEITDEETARSTFADPRLGGESRNTNWRLNDLGTTIHAIKNPMSGTSEQLLEGEPLYFELLEVRPNYKEIAPEERNITEKLAVHNEKIHPDFHPDKLYVRQRIYFYPELEETFRNISNLYLDSFGLPDSVQQDMDDLKKGLKDKDSKIEDLVSTLDRAEQVVSDQTDALKNQRSVLDRWRAGPIVSLEAYPLRPSVGLGATTPRNRLMTFEYTIPSETTDSYQTELREDAPANRGPHAGTAVRLTNTTNTTNSSRVKAGVGVPLSDNFKVLLTGGAQLNDYQTDITDKSFIERDGLQLNLQKDNFTQTDSSIDFLVGSGITYDLSDNFTIKLGGDVNTSSGELNGNVGIIYNIGGFKK